jgi:hypothetical protein
MHRFALALVTALLVAAPASAQIDQIKAKLDAEGRFELRTATTARPWRPSWFTPPPAAPHRRCS